MGEREVTEPVKKVKNRKERYVTGQAFIGLVIFILIYTFFYTSTYRAPGGSVGELGQSVALSMTAVLVGMLVELGRFWGWAIEFKVNSDLLILQGVPAAIIGIIPGPLWIDAGGKTFPFIFFADPVVTGIAGVWLGIVLFRGLFEIKKVKEEEETRKKSPTR